MPRYKLTQQLFLFHLLPIAVYACLFVIRGSFFCGEGDLAAITREAAAAAASASLAFWQSSSMWFACCLPINNTCPVVAATYYSYDRIPRVKNIHATQLCCGRSNSGVRSKLSSYSSAACGSFVTRGGYLHLVLLRAHCCCFELRAAGRPYSYLLLIQKAKRHVPSYFS